MQPGSLIRHDKGSLIRHDKTMYLSRTLQGCFSAHEVADLRIFTWDIFVDPVWVPVDSSSKATSAPRYRAQSEDLTKFASPSASLHFASPAVG